MRERNKELLLSTLDHIENHREQWSQEDWFTLFDTPAEAAEASLCKTAACFAGHAAALSGAVPPTEARPWGVAPDLSPVVWVDYRPGGWCEVPECGVCETRRQMFEAMPEGTVHVSTFARDRLGLTDLEADLLFRGSNSLPDLRLIVQGFVDGGSLEDVVQALTELRMSSVGEDEE